MPFSAIDHEFQVQSYNIIPGFADIPLLSSEKISLVFIAEPGVIPIAGPRPLLTLSLFPLPRALPVPSSRH